VSVESPALWSVVVGTDGQPSTTTFPR
jgi:hypothetical protein